MSTTSLPAGDWKVMAANGWTGVHVAVNSPSPACTSPCVPSSTSAKVSPFDVTAVTGPTGDAQLMLSADTLAG